MQSKINNISLIFTFSFVGIYFSLLAPDTVQMLDTGELVTNAYSLSIIHPPGYPLFTWLYGFFTNLPLNFSPFYLASLFTIALSILTLYLLSKFSRQQRVWDRILFIFLLASSPFYWRYSLLPDVFMLHLLLVSTIVYLYFESNRDNALLFLWGVSLAHHHTSLFLFPFICDVLYKSNDPKKWRYLGGGVLIAIMLYLSLLLLNTSSMTSWGELLGLFGLVKHILRSDYGTLSLAVGASLKWWETLEQGLEYYISLSVTSFIPIYFILFTSLLLDTKKLLSSHQLKILLITIVVYLLIFFSLANVTPLGLGKEVLGRFGLMADLLIVMMGILLFQRSMVWKKNHFKWILYALFVVTIYKNYFENHQENNYQQNTVMEDWAKNKLNSLGDKAQSSIVLESEDSKLFSLYYVQNVLKYRADIAVISPILLLRSWYFDKVLNHYPELSLDRETFITDKNYNLYKDLIIPNINHYSFAVGTLEKSTAYFSYSYSPLGTLISKNKTVFTSGKLVLLRNERDAIRSSDNLLFENEKKIIGEYCNFYLQQANMASERGLLTDSISFLKQALDQTPFCYSAANRLCRLTKEKQFCTKAYRLSLFKSLF